MSRTVTVTFSDGSTHVYANAPDNITPEEVTARASKDFGKAVTHLDGGKAASPAKQEPMTFGGALAEAPIGALNQIGDAISAIPKAVGNIAQGVYKYGMSYPAHLGSQIGEQLPAALANQLGGQIQFARNLSPKALQGSAPVMQGGEADKHPWLSLTQGNTMPLKQQIANKPLNLLADAAGIAGTTAPGRWFLGKTADAAMAAPRAIVRALADMTPEYRAQNALLQGARATPGSTPQAIAAALDANRSPVPGVNFTAAQAAPDPGLIALERQSRVNPNTAPAWANFDTNQNTGMFNAMSNIVNPADDAAVAAARESRDAATRPYRQASQALANQGSLEPIGGFDAPHAPNYPEQFSQPIRDAAGTQMTLPGPRVNPAVQRTGNYVQESLPMGGSAAEDAYEVRKRLGDALNSRHGQSLTDLDASIKSADVSSRVIRSSIDGALNRASGGMWGDYLRAFQDSSRDVKSLEALNAIRGELADRIAGRGLNDLAGNPKLTRAYINQIIERHSTDKYGDRIAPDVMQRLNDIRRTAQDIEAPQANYKLSVTGGGGSNTAHDVALGGAMHLANALGMGPLARFTASVARGAGSIGEEAGATRLANILQDQGEAGRAIRAAVAREEQRRGRRSSGMTPAALAAALVSQQQ